MSILLETRGLSKIYGKGENEVRALNKCDLTFAEGSFTSIVGRSGSGKSTLMHLLGGLDTPTTGAVFIEGEEYYRSVGQRADHLPPPAGGIHLSVLQSDARTDRLSEHSAAHPAGRPQAGQGIY